MHMKLFVRMYHQYHMFSPYAHVRMHALNRVRHSVAIYDQQKMCMRSKAWLAASVSLRLARLPRTASSAQRSRRLRSTLAAAPGLRAHALVTKQFKTLTLNSDAMSYSGAQRPGLPLASHSGMGKALTSPAWLRRSFSRPEKTYGVGDVRIYMYD